ncbi:MAG: LysR family transcriptional regulator [Sphaerospermopsis sp. SIO1G2]|nr:LysR family transcriptional regulator [Sphaerospermopsis sp. SIO1G2]
MADYNEVAIFVEIVDCGSFSAAARKLIEDGNMSTLMVDWNAISRPVHLVYPSKRNLSRNMRAFIDTLVPMIKESLTARRVI